MKRCVFKCLWCLHLRVSPPHRASDLPSSSFCREVRWHSTIKRIAALPPPFKFACSVSGTQECTPWWRSHGSHMLLLDSQVLGARNMMSGGNHIGVYLLLLDAKVIPATLI
ncbi:Uncharacterized protein Rs2_38463 [Raphanus sativus]|nr:Uncharacterized protein Rs2_38463 [Raphanus sativus]